MMRQHKMALNYIKYARIRVFIGHKVTIKNANFFVLIVSCLRTHQRKRFTVVLASFSLRHRRHSLELWLYNLWVPKISQDMFEVLLDEIIFQYSFDSSLSVWYLILLNVFLWFGYLSLNAVSQTP